MSLTAEEREVMWTLEIERAERIMREEVPVQKKARLWNLLANRLYYAVFHAVSGLLIKNGIQVSSHKGLHMMLNEKFVRTGVFTIEERHVLTQLEALRHQGDYNCFLDTTEEEITPYIEQAQALIDKIKCTIGLA